MEKISAFSIPFRGMREGMHQFEYQIDHEFFELFEASPIKSGRFDIQLYFDKRPDLFVLSFDIQGVVDTECDRCLASINLPLSTSRHLMIKFAEDPFEEDDVIYISPEAYELNIAPYLYEFICLGMPISKVYDCQEEEEPPCDFDTLDRLDYQEDGEEEALENNPFAEAFKKLNSKKS